MSNRYCSLHSTAKTDRMQPKRELYVLSSELSLKRVPLLSDSAAIRLPHLPPQSL